jgi:hypothetical protein
MPMASACFKARIHSCDEKQVVEKSSQLYLNPVKIEGFKKSL